MLTLFLPMIALGQALLCLHVPPPVGNQAKETTLGQADCALYTPSFCPQCPWYKAVESPSPVASELPSLFQVPLGA